ncbi:hypothetical protein [Devosia aquimaris]|uniref:hypothetical protein n=1 Tax=Devosia aquimaris TaxID=2866214 RepID=UPI001CD101A2|nr:hypothetical protein [Devosia sp. CJK-A8-3]
MAINAHRAILTVAVRYLDAARVLHKSSTTADDFWQPLNHLFAMAAELALKSFLERVGTSEKELKEPRVRHSLKELLLMAVSKGLRASHEVADVILEMDAAHATHAFRYVPRPSEGQTIMLYTARPANAYAAIQRLLDQCAADPASIRELTMFPGEWPPAHLPERPITGDQLREWSAEKERLRQTEISFQSSEPPEPDWFFTLREAFFVTGFVRDQDDKLVQSADPREMESEEQALDLARAMVRSDYAGVVAWKHIGVPPGSMNGPREILYRFGEVPGYE